jgi:hypothetical protein
LGFPELFPFPGISPRERFRLGRSALLSRKPVRRISIREFEQKPKIRQQISSGFRLWLWQINKTAEFRSSSRRRSDGIFLASSPSIIQLSSFSQQ